MNEIWFRILVLLAGVALGTVFFGGLWLTVRQSVLSKRPALWIFGSFVLRTGLALTGFYLIASDSWQRFLICLLGFITGRFLIIYLTRKDEVNQAGLKKEQPHEA